MRKSGPDRHWCGRHIGWDIWNTTGNYRFSAPCFSVSRENLRSPAMTPEATAFPTRTLANFRWTLGSATWKPLSMRPASKSFHFSGYRKGARLRSRLLCGIRSACRILFCMVGLRLAVLSARTTPMRSENDLPQW